MKTPPDTIKAWLKNNNRDRQWLADQCRVSKSTVDGWLGGGGKREIPGPSQTVITALMHSDPVTPRFSLDQYEKIQKKAAEAGMSVSEWVEAAIKAALLLVAVSFLGFHFQRAGNTWTTKALSKSADSALALVASALK